MKSTREMIEVMEAFDRGSDIEVRGRRDSEWEDASGPCWDWRTYDYRIKPEPPEETAYRKACDAQQFTGVQIDETSFMLGWKAYENHVRTASAY